MAATRIFITGTDTDVGKTFVSQILLRALSKQGLTTAVLKPVAAGAKDVEGMLQNDDALMLQRLATAQQPYEEINPFVFAQAIAPHLAADQCSTPLSAAICKQRCEAALARDVDCLLIEGAGGWLVPLNSHETMADLALSLKSKVVLVVGMRLGCINHALLTAQAITQSGVELVGWVANYVQNDVEHAPAIVESIASKIAAPLLGEVPYTARLVENPNDLALIDSFVDYLDITPLF